MVGGGVNYQFLSKLRDHQSSCISTSSTSFLSALISSWDRINGIIGVLGDGEKGMDQGCVRCWDANFFFFFFCFLGSHPWKFPGWGTNRSYSCRPMPQQRHIRALSATYSTAHGNAGSLTQWVRAGTEPATSWILVGFDSIAPWRELMRCKI